MSLIATPIGLSVISTYNGLCLCVSWYPVSVLPFKESVIGYNLYRSEIPYDAFTRIANFTTLVGLTYWDLPPTPNDNSDNIWWYRVSSFDGAIESYLSGPSTYVDYASMDNKPLPGASWSSLF